MAYELLNFSQVTPARLYAFLRLVGRMKNAKKDDILDALQPAFLFKNKNDEEDDIPTQKVVSGKSSRSSSSNVYTAARNCNLIQEMLDGTVHLEDDVEQYLTSMQQFCLLMQKMVWGVTEENKNNSLFNLFTAWYIVQNERVYQFEDKDIEVRFNEELDEHSEERKFNMIKFVGWRMWATFLGLGRQMTPNLSGTARAIILPDVSNRIQSIFSQLLPELEHEFLFSQFIDNVANICPELDGGELFMRCREASRGSEQVGQNVSLALSTALQKLHMTKKIELVRRPDTSNIWTLYPGAGLEVKEVSHIQLLELTSYGK